MSSYSGTDNLEVMQEAHNYNQYLIDLVTEHAGSAKSILDFGAGIGTFARILKERGLPVSCLEPDSAQAKRIEKSGLNVYNALESIKAQSLEYIYTLNVIEHIEDDKALLKELRSKLKEGGRILIYVPAFMLLFSAMDTKVGHYRRYTAKSLKQLAKESGYGIEKSEYVDSAGFFATLLYKYIGDKDGGINTGALIFYDRFLFPLSRFMDNFFRHIFGKNVYIVLKKESIG